MAGQKSNKNRKYNRNRVKCKIYRDRNKKLRNKIRKLRRHLKKFSTDMQALSALSRHEGKK